MNKYNVKRVIIGSKDFIIQLYIEMYFLISSIYTCCAKCHAYAY